MGARPLVYGAGIRQRAREQGASSGKEGGTGGIGASPCFAWTSFQLPQSLSVLMSQTGFSDHLRTLAGLAVKVSCIFFENQFFFLCENVCLGIKMQHTTRNHYSMNNDNDYLL